MEERIRELGKRLAAAERSAAEYRAIFENCQVGILVFDGDRIITKANQRVADIYGYDSPDEMIGQSADKGHASPEASRAFARQYFETLREDARLHIRFRARRKDGSLVWCRVSGNAIDTNIPRDLSRGVVWIIDDISELVESQERLERLARFDPLTEVATKHFFQERVREALAFAQRYSNPLSLLMIDLDHFKRVNDAYGHQAGDEVLAGFGRRMRKLIRQTDLAGRLGGDEFALLLPGTPVEKAQILAARLKETTEKEPFATTQADIPLTISIGAAQAESTTPDVDSLLNHADKALYRAKDEGRNCVRIYR